MKLFEELDKLTDQGYLRKVISPCGELVLYNYTDHCTFKKHWNNLTLGARGTTYNIETGEVVAKAFPKFFNFGELEPPIQKAILNERNFQVFEKMDGSLGIVYNYKGEWRVNTRGSFTSEQAIRATEMLKKYDLSNINPRFTLLVEIIYPENRIIVDYGDEEKLVLLAAMCGQATEATYVQLEGMAMIAGMEVCPKLEFETIDELIGYTDGLSAMEEGFVARFRDGFRIKFKSAEYLKLARLMSNMTPLNFWRNMTNGIVDQEAIEKLPEEFREEVDRQVADIQQKYQEVKKEVEEDFRYAIQSIGGLTELEDDRKALGLWLKENGGELKHAGAMFPRLLNSGAGIDKYIMKSIRPRDNVL